MQTRVAAVLFDLDTLLLKDEEQWEAAEKREEERKQVAERQAAG